MNKNETPDEIANRILDEFDYNSPDEIYARECEETDREDEWDRQQER